MTVWVVDDTRKHAAQAKAAIVQEIVDPEVRVFINHDIAWPQDQTMPKLHPDPGPRSAGSAQGLPDIVVLDLLDESGEQTMFAGKDFYERLRTEEANSHKGQKAYVIVWSQYRGLKQTEAFVASCADRDRRHVIILEQKIPEILAEKVKECWQMIKDGD